MNVHTLHNSLKARSLEAVLPETLLLKTVLPEALALEAVPKTLTLERQGLLA